ncbi:uncharacterized protein MYCFIDRAFT_172635 [Pseudocercospora fijiensis CIRAD86]|uniref:Uncharacterized protein n=1 Tax=Pseudocercospora fijiensis (strain CIRAD86) TaxID=383855 RepID=M2ZAU2_PSEFD|nr:uncharacterized protein MYCFIDRAFT_172635 [Pseudocercospora fijiensis CIRAD86]EME86955.1 hypothetical protein MYCFIDRAFT_172635 [Pseudocercospora fijiensis CIRAD86]
MLAKLQDTSLRMYIDHLSQVQAAQNPCSVDTNRIWRTSDFDANAVQLLRDENTARILLMDLRKSDVFRLTAGMSPAFRSIDDFEDALFSGFSKLHLSKFLMGAAVSPASFEKGCFLLRLMVKVLNRKKQSQPGVSRKVSWHPQPRGYIEQAHSIHGRAVLMTSTSLYAGVLHDTVTPLLVGGPRRKVWQRYCISCGHDDQSNFTRALRCSPNFVLSHFVPSYVPGPPNTRTLNVVDHVKAEGLYPSSFPHCQEMTTLAPVWRMISWRSITIPGRSEDRLLFRVSSTDDMESQLLNVQTPFLGRTSSGDAARFDGYAQPPTLANSLFPGKAGGTSGSQHRPPARDLFSFAPSAIVVAMVLRKDSHILLVRTQKENIWAQPMPSPVLLLSRELGSMVWFLVLKFDAQLCRSVGEVSVSQGNWGCLDSACLTETHCRKQTGFGNPVRSTSKPGLQSGLRLHNLS